MGHQMGRTLTIKFWESPPGSRGRTEIGKGEDRRKQIRGKKGNGNSKYINDPNKRKKKNGRVWGGEQ